MKSEIVLFNRPRVVIDFAGSPIKLESRVEIRRLKRNGRGRCTETRKHFRKKRTSVNTARGEGNKNEPQTRRLHGRNSTRNNGARDPTTSHRRADLKIRSGSFFLCIYTRARVEDFDFVQPLATRATAIQIYNILYTLCIYRNL